ncbi:hypothetical protein [Rhodococcoides fascians]|uniref:hypothetical protein n=1 Tax=Rhodococcoides fascians TaxID=1828 RepID=UPI0005230B03|nr:hypothetical protein [Rhodococcus fascians]
MQDSEFELPEPEQLVVYHVLGDGSGTSELTPSRYDTEFFRIDDASSVLIVESNDPDPRTRRPIAAFNREFWVHADFEPVPREVIDDAAAGDQVST